MHLRDKEGSFEESLRSIRSFLRHDRDEPWRTSIPLRRIMPLVAGFMALFVFLTVTLLRSGPMSISSPAEEHEKHEVKITSSNCGSNAETARERKCIFDPSSFSWLPVRCADVHLTSRFLAHEKWIWYNSTTPDDLSASELIQVPLDVVLRGELDELFVTDRYHAVHCIYMWKKLHRALDVEETGVEPGSESGAWRDSYISNLAHTDHCSDLLLAWEQNTPLSNGSSLRGGSESHHDHMADFGRDLGRVLTVIKTKYPDCPTAVEPLR